MNRNERVILIEVGPIEEENYTWYAERVVSERAISIAVDGHGFFVDSGTRDPFSNERIFLRQS
jgi:hypothetical protein